MDTTSRFFLILYQESINFNLNDADKTGTELAFPLTGGTADEH
jgi:hypothetical protein